MIPEPFLILASRSPRRRELLAEAGYQFQVMAPDEDVECGVCSEAGPAGLVSELAYRKAAAIAKAWSKEREAWSMEHGGESGESIAPTLRSRLSALGFSPSGSPLSALCSPLLVLGADTVAECDGLVLGKPRDEADARAMLTKLSGREHRVLTGVCLWPLSLPLTPVEDSPWLGEGRGEQAPLLRVAVTKLRMDSLTDAQLDDYLASGQWEGKAGAFGYQDRLGWVHIVEGSATNVVGLPMELLAEMITEIVDPAS
jgi:septum formation protein